MEPDDLDETICADCGAILDSTREPTFSITDDIALCLTCSVRRGGQWDGGGEKWQVAPQLEGLRFGGGTHAPP